VEETRICARDTTHTETRTVTLEAHLSGLPANTAANPYTIVLNVNDLGLSGTTLQKSDVGAALGSSRYVSLDLSGSNLASIGDYAFYSCTRLTSVTIGNSVTSIGDDAFHSCTSLTTAIIPNSVTSIGSWAFYGCTNLSDISISNSVTSIGSAAFTRCTRLTSVTIPDSVTSIADGAFHECSSLMSISVNAGNSAYSSEDGILYNKNKTVLHIYPGGKTGAFTIPNNVTSIRAYAFFGCTGLTNVTIPNSVTSIGSYAFANTGLTSVAIPDSVTSISLNPFMDCSSLTSISVTAGNPAYSSVDGILYNKNQTTLHAYPVGKTGAFIIPNSVTNIANYAFYGCTNLASVTIGNSVTSIGSSAFCNCSNLTSITIGNSVASIEELAFFRCSSLTSVTFAGTIPSAGFDTSSSLTFPGDLRAKFYVTDPANGTPGTYTTSNPGSNPTWMKQP
jgi:hypothetical protein